MNKLKTFQTDGFVRIPSVISMDSIKEIQSLFWNEIKIKFHIDIDDPKTWKINPNNPAGDSRALRLNGMNSIMKKLNDSGCLSPLESKILEEFDCIFGKNKWTPLDLWYSLLGFPGRELSWNVPHKSWHNDEPIVVGHRMPWSIFTFVFLDEVTTDQGPTVVVSGSHRRGELLAEKIGVRDSNSIKAFENVNHGLVESSEDVKLLPVGKLLNSLVAKDLWFRDLVDENFCEDRIQKFLYDGSTYKNIQHKVAKLTGSPGDIIMLDPRCLHTFSANISALPRQVLRLDFRQLG